MKDSLGDAFGKVRGDGALPWVQTPPFGGYEIILRRYLENCGAGSSFSSDWQAGMSGLRRCGDIVLGTTRGTNWEQNAIEQGRKP
jgi:hypothetical protein